MVIEELIGCVAVLLATASIIDWIMADTAVSRLRRSEDRVQRHLTALGDGKAVVSANRLLCEVFDAVYGGEFWSWQRVRRSCFLSVMAYLFVFLLVGIENSVWGIDEDPFFAFFFGSRSGFFFGMMLVFMPINLVADFLSLQETRWVMERARGSQVWGVATWATLDLVFTTLIYLVILALSLVGSVAFDDWDFLGVDWPETFGILFTPFALPFFLSTFATSALWFGFVLLVVVAGAGRRGSRTVAKVLDVIADSKAPARAVAWVISAPIVVGYVAVEAWWLVFR